MTWIKTIDYEASQGRLRQLYDRIAGPGENIDNIMMSHSLRPHTMEGHMALYKATLHHARNATPEWFLEALGVWVSLLNRCDYCVDHHAAGMRRLLADSEADAGAILTALRARSFENGPFTEAQIAALRYAEALTLAPHEVERRQVEAMRAAGLDDGEILEVNQVTAYFAYANRTVMGLGCSAEGDIIGRSPTTSENAEDWRHG